MARVATTIEGGLIASDLVEQIAATPQDVFGQRPSDFGVDARLSDEIQKAFSDALAYWNAFQTRLARGKESLTTITRETWVLPLLEELGFSLAFQRSTATAGGGTFMISHRLGTDPAAPPVHIVSCEQELDRKGDAARSAHALVQDYLNRSDALWGIVTNGLKLRLLRNTVRFSKPSYVEFDLEAIFQGNLYSEFVLFYRLVHASRLPRDAADAHECWLERYYQQGIEQGGRVRDRLRDGVEEALKILGSGFLTHAENNRLREKLGKGELKHLDYYRQLLRLIYRLLFLMVAEERRLLFVPDAENAARQAIYDRWYSIERLRKRAPENRLYDDGHSDLWEGLKQTFTLFKDSRHASQLGLTALDGELFGLFACADLIGKEGEPGPRLRNAGLLAAIWHLSTFEDVDSHKRKASVRRRVNFGGLDVEEFGSVYESLLDYHPEVRIDGARSNFDLIVGSERKATGSYYTPPALVSELIKSALEPVIEERLTKAGSRDEKERALLSLKVCDPASGSGHFMLAAARRIGRELARVRSGEAEPNPSDYRHAVRDVIRRCIYAVDKNPLAVDLCKVALWIEGHEAGLPLSFLDHHVKCGDSLVGVFDLKVLEAGVPHDAYKAVTGDDNKVAAEIKKQNSDEAKRDSLFRHSVKQDIAQVAGAFGAIADLPETSPGEVQAKEAAYSALRRGAEWGKAKWACDLWTAAFLAPLSNKTAGTVPTTRDVWDAIGGRLPQGRIARSSIDLAIAQRFFHWPLEFPEVFAATGFNAVLGNPPWEVSQLGEDEYFAQRLPSIAKLKGQARKKAIAALEQTNPVFFAQYQLDKRQIEAANDFSRSCGRFDLTARGKINTYALFAELAASMIHHQGRVGLVLKSEIATGKDTAAFFDHLIHEGRLISLFDFENRERIFDIHSSYRFCLLTLGNVDERPTFAFNLTNPAQLTDQNRTFGLQPEDIERMNPNTHTAVVISSRGDAEVLRQLYRNGAVLIQGEGVNERPLFDLVVILNQFSASNENDRSLFVMTKELSTIDNSLAPVIRGSLIHQFDHHFGTFDLQTEGIRHVTLDERNNPEFNIISDKYVPRSALMVKLEKHNWQRNWLLGWRDQVRATDVRTMIAVAVPMAAADDSFSLLLPRENPRFAAALLGNLNSLCLDFVVQRKITTFHLRKHVLAQLPILSPASYTPRDLNFVVSRVLELSYVAEDMRPFAEDLDYYGPPFRWDPTRRALLRAELDAYYAYLYGLTRRELEYILDPKEVMGQDYPSDTFRVLKENEIKEFGEYRTRRFVLEAWDRFVPDGTFDPAGLREPQYIDRVAQELIATRAKLAQVEHDSKALLALASATPKPTLFVEGVTDAKIIEAAWAVFFPSEPMPVKVIAAGGTKEMGSLAGKGKALREVLGDHVVLVLADNDSAGRSLVTEDGRVRRGGTWRLLLNGIHWCLLEPTESFAAAMKSYNIPENYWPFTIEAAFSPALRRAAEADGAYKFSGNLQTELFDNPEIARRLVSALPKLNPQDDAYWYLMAPQPEAKDTFASWVTDPKRRTEENYAAFEEIIRRLSTVLAPNMTRSRGAA
jgi:hypothetical protein